MNVDDIFRLESKLFSAMYRYRALVFTGKQSMGICVCATYTCTRQSIFDAILYSENIYILLLFNLKVSMSEEGTTTHRIPASRTR